MKKIHLKSVLAIVLSACCLVSGSTSQALAGNNSKISSDLSSILSDKIDESRQDELFIQGNVYGNYKVEKVGHLDFLRADTAILENTVSGTLLYLVRNDDPEKGFDISYKVPNLNNADIPHIFEHSILAASDKYPSHYLYFDISKMTYNTFANAATTNITTSYMFSSISQKQFFKLIDAYMSCMVSPAVLENENYFKREAVRYELLDKDEPITLSGVVLSEDLGFLPDGDRRLYREITGLLYPDTIYESSLGYCYEDLENLTFENMKKVYDDYYHFDNAMIYLYGDMDYKTILDYLDSEYLSKYPKRKKTVSVPEAPVQKGHVEEVIDLPVYKDSEVSNRNQIWYAFDLSSFTPKDITDLDVWTEFLHISNSPLEQKLHDAGIYNNYNCHISIDRATYPILIFMLSDTSDEIKKETFKKIVDEVISDIGTGGIDEKLFVSAAKSLKKNSAFESILTTQIFDRSLIASCYWAQSGSPDYLDQLEKSQKEILNDRNQKTIKNISRKLQDVDRTALMEGKPKPGLAEKIEEDIENYLRDMKAQMSPEEIQQMIDDTEAFNKWNETTDYNRDLSIRVEDLPEVQPYDEVKAETFAGIHVATVELPEDYDIYSTTLHFDTSSVSQEELYDLAFFTDMLGSLDTDKHSLEELNYEASLAGDISFNLTYDKNTEPFNRPYFNVSISGLSEDYTDTLPLANEILSSSKFEKDRIFEVIDILINANDPYNASSQISSSIVQDCEGLNTGYINYVYGEGYYRYLRDLKKKLQKNPSYINELSERMSNIRTKIYHKDNLAMDIIASKKTKAEIKQATRTFLLKLPKGSKQDYRKEYDFLIPEEQSIAYAVNDSLCCTSFVFASDEEISGKYLPFIKALENEYFLPELRYKNSVYSPTIACSVGDDAIYFDTFRDPSPALTLDIIKNSPEAMRALKMDKQTLEDYKISVLKRFTAPFSILERCITSLRFYYKDVPLDYTVKAEKELKSATPEDKEGAAKLLDKAVANGTFVAAGNGSILDNDKKVFDKVVKYN